ncbi:uncharacterized protein C15orf32 [Pan paniscus]|uniref:Uncharacterized protein C15orf32 n=2 Tax=Homo sapiens TaxID=9606 RepID=CO032_HUMAN|nr:uncharacterized protein C15orf32 [Pan paniscus]Q32M92.2 RecName: Full=Uncharacterized protein C15orf32 [Homo sapiens]AAI09254.1 Chromosome 15 open reading frame 32 [Homo sapiens]ACS13729.1 uncharacterized protein C15orf32 [Homo sapiens]EAX02151.1 chromosome 15 open reading frame 32 [Homo sapiens]BAB71467.1 unnamed protein product [Homo sapiens]|eukprot:NP_694585.1 uncharacterized protein C15orf32 isoform a [Homo sapiens]
MNKRTSVDASKEDLHPADPQSGEGVPPNRKNTKTSPRGEGTAPPFSARPCVWTLCEMLSILALVGVLHPFYRSNNQVYQKLKTHLRCQSSRVDGLMLKPTLLTPSQLKSPEGHLILPTFNHLVIRHILDPKQIFCVADVCTDCKFNCGSIERHQKRHLMRVSQDWEHLIRYRNQICLS